MSSRKYRANVSSLVKELSAAHRVSTLVSPDAIMSAKRKPKGVSDVRWRIELRRRADPGRYEVAPGV